VPFILGLMVMSLEYTVLCGLASAAPGRQSERSQDSQASQALIAGTDKYALDRHTVTVTFNYDFQKNPSCQEKPKFKKRVAQFAVYDVSRQPIKLFTISVPEGARGLVTHLLAFPSCLLIPLINRSQILPPSLALQPALLP